jgi:hypothetical protein
VWGDAGDERPPKAGFFRRLLTHAVGLPDEAPSWERLADRPRHLPEDTTIRVSRDGRLHVLSRRADWMAIFARDGSLLHRGPTGAEGLVDDVHDWDVDDAGRVVVLFDHTEELRGSQYAHVARIIDGRFDLWLGPHASESIPFIGQHARWIAVEGDGSIWVGHGFRQLRKITAEGVVTWLSPGTAEHDSYELEDLEKNLRGKKVARDRGS